jgi:hypothetical protein
MPQLPGRTRYMQIINLERIMDFLESTTARALISSDFDPEV